MLDVLGIAPHPDDAELATAGAIMKLLDEGKRGDDAGVFGGNLRAHQCVLRALVRQRGYHCAPRLRIIARSTAGLGR